MTSNTMPRRPHVTAPPGSILGRAAFTPGSAEAHCFANLLAALGCFAATVGSKIISPSMELYLSRLRNDGLKEQIARTNSELASRGFGDTSRSTVRTIKDCIYYPVVREGCDCLSFAAPFFDTLYRTERVTLIEGAHMAGLALAASEMRKKNVLQPVIRQTLAPVTGKQLAEGDRLQGYQSPLIYKSETATVYADYRPRNETSGTVIVEAQCNRSGQLLIGKKWEVRYT